MKKFVFCFLLLFCFTSFIKAQDKVKYKPSIQLIVASQDKQIAENFETLFDTDRILAGYESDDEISEYSFRVTLFKHKTEVLISSVLLKRKPTQCDPNGIEFVTIFTAVNTDESRLASQTFKYLNEKVWKPEIAKREKLLNF